MDVTTNSAFRIVFGVASQTLDAAVICFGSPDPLRNTEASNLLAPQIPIRGLVLRKPRYFDTLWFSGVAAQLGAAERLQSWWRRQLAAARVEREYGFAGAWSKVALRQAQKSRVGVVQQQSRKGAESTLTKEQGERAKAYARRHEARVKARRATERTQLRLAMNDGGDDTTHIGPVMRVASESSDEFLSDEHMLPGESSSDEDSAAPSLSPSSSSSSSSLRSSEGPGEKKRNSLRFVDDVLAPDDGLSVVSSVMSDGEFAFASDAEFDLSSSSSTSKNDKAPTVRCLWEVEILDDEANDGCGRWLKAEISHFAEALHKATVWIPAYLLEGEIELELSHVRFLKRRQRIDDGTGEPNDETERDFEASLFSRLRAKARSAQDLPCNWLIALRDEDSEQWIGGSANRYRAFDNSLFVSFPSLNLEGPMELDGAHVKLISCESGDTTARNFFSLVRMRLEAGIAAGGEPANDMLASQQLPGEPADPGIQDVATAGATRHVDVHWQCEINDDDEDDEAGAGWHHATISAWIEEDNLVLVSMAQPEGEILEGEILLDSTFVKLHSCITGEEKLFARAKSAADATARSHASKTASDSSRHELEVSSSGDGGSGSGVAAESSMAVSDSELSASSKETTGASAAASGQASLLSTDGSALTSQLEASVASSSSSSSSSTKFGKVKKGRRFFSSFGRQKPKANGEGKDATASAEVADGTAAAAAAVAAMHAAKATSS
jgi:hypothetical protein